MMTRSVELAEASQRQKGVAREYGIPAVLATGDATKKLKDGELVIVDGTKGVVTVCNRNVGID